MAAPFIWGKYVWTLFHGLMDQLDKLDKNQWILMDVIRFLDIFGRLLPCPACSQHFSTEIHQLFDVATGLRPEKLLAWTIDLRGRISSRAKREFRSVEFCTPKYDLAWFSEAWKGLQIISFSTFTTSNDLEWFMTKLLSIFPGLSDPEKQKASINILNSVKEWSLSREKFALVVYRLSKEIQTEPRLVLPDTLKEMNQNWIQEVNNAIELYHETKAKNENKSNTPTTDNKKSTTATTVVLDSHDYIPPLLPSQQKKNESKEEKQINEYAPPLLPSQQRKQESQKDLSLATVASGGGDGEASSAGSFKGASSSTVNGYRIAYWTIIGVI